jgi:hypothetical protein
MYRLYYPERDTTIYERYPEQNTGIDQILELTKIASGSKLEGVIQANSYNSRILIDFGSQITKIGDGVTDGDIPTIDNHPDSASIFLKLYAADASNLLHTYSIHAMPVSESWVNGNGKFIDEPIQKYGASWYYRSSDDVGDYWAAGSGELGTTETVYGGGSYITGSGNVATQSFQNELPDLRINVTDIVKKWIDGTNVNNGFIIKRPYSDESSGEVLGNLKFFSRESHTIFIPRLEVIFNDTTLSGTGSVTEISADTYVPYFKNIKSEYRMSEITKFRIGVRPEFPDKSFQTSSFYITGERLPTSSFYSILDSVTNETIIPFNTTGSKIDCDANGSFFKLRMDSFMPERYYKIMLKIERTDDIQTFDDFYFKVVN